MSDAEIRGAFDLAHFILGHYSGKVVEIGVGKAIEVAVILAKDLDVVATDKATRIDGDSKIIADDIFYPDLDLYRDASLLYSIRPPLEMQIAMGKLALDIGAEIIVRPLMDEVAQLPEFNRTLVNTGQARFYLFTRSHS
ncbi:MAG: UPF0146 family protein [Methanotrichaceae archaeon]